MDARRLQRTNEVRGLTIEHEDRLLAVAVGRWDALHGSLHGDLHVEPGHLPVGTRTRLVDEFLNLYAKPGMRLQVTLPAGDAEILQRLRERCSRVTTRRAGATSLVDASVLGIPRGAEPTCSLADFSAAHEQRAKVGITDR